ncbi:hypothetical protein [Castellaniella sp.]|uniref:hypothetical protein n=1 Tax=Castellaniella sp. TaxID=1955812 RepID=UPI002AFFE9B8|nr:hypothetical protein [Castellaniella sp.]
MNLPTRLLPAAIDQHGPSFLRAIALLAIACGIGIWGALLLAPAPAPAPAQLGQSSTSGQAPDAVVAWFGSGRGQLHIKILGLIVGGPRGTVLLSVDGAPAQAYRLGDTLAPGAILDTMTADGISISLDGTIQHIAAPSPAPAAAGFEPILTH